MGNPSVNYGITNTRFYHLSTKDYNLVFFDCIECKRCYWIREKRIPYNKTCICGNEIQVQWYFDKRTRLIIKRPENPNAIVGKITWIPAH